MGLKYKEKRERGRKRFLVSFSQSKFSHFSNKKLTSCWNNTLLSAGIGWNFRSGSLLLGHIQPVAIENTACKAALCCKEIVLVVAVGCGLTPFYLNPSSLVYKHQQTIVPSLIVAFLQWHQLDMCSCCWERVRKWRRRRARSEQHSTHQRKSVTSTCAGLAD